MASMISSLDQGGGGSFVGDPDTVTLTDTPNIFRSTVNNTTKRPNRIRPYPLSDVNDLKIQQGLIIKDLLFCSLGYEGCYIRYSEKFDGSIDDSKVRGPDFKIAKHLDISLKSITKNLIKFGKFYSGLQGFIEVYDSPKYGTVIQKFCNNIQKFLESYQQVIISIEQEFKFNARFTLNLFEISLNQIANHIIHLYEISIEIHELNIQRQAGSATNQLQDFFANVNTTLKKSGIIDTNINSEPFDSCKGGLVLRIIQARINLYKGDTVSYEFLTKLFDFVSEDYVVMLNAWLIGGEINDPSDEFLIREKQVPPTFLEIFNSQSEHYWNELFIIRTDGLIDQFTSLDIQKKLLNTGKYLNIFKNCTGITSFQGLEEVIQPISKIFSKDLELKINEFYNRANKLLMKLLFEGFGLKGVIGDYQSIFLLDDSYRVDKFIDKSFYDLKRNRYAVSLSKIQKQYKEVMLSNSGINAERKRIGTRRPALLDEQFEDDISQNVIAQETSLAEPEVSLHEYLLNKQKFSITTTNFYQVSKEIMNVQSFDSQVFQNDANFQNLFQNLTQHLPPEPSTQDSGSTSYDQNQSDGYAISSVDLTISLPFPLNLIINRELSYHYELMFKLQIMIKFLNKFNDITWKNINQSSVWKYSKFEPRIKKWILRCRILHKRMIDFLNELQIYFNYDVIEANYNKLQGYLYSVEVELQKAELGSDITTDTGNNQVHSNRITSLSNYNSNSTSFFDTKIQNHENKRSKNHSRTQASISVDDLMNKLNEYVNTLINDSLITKEDLLDNLKIIFDMIISYNHYLNRLKKVLILCNQELFDGFASDYPDKFTEKAIDQNSIDARFENLNESLKAYYENFGDSLTNFIITLRRFGEIENKKILTLSERLELCFPE